jgi:hypothetical protein
VRQSPKQKLAFEYGRNLRDIRCACAILANLQHRLGFDYLKVPFIQGVLEKDARDLYEKRKKEL